MDGGMGRLIALCADDEVDEMLAVRKERRPEVRLLMPRRVERRDCNGITAAGRYLIERRRTPGIEAEEDHAVSIPCAAPGAAASSWKSAQGLRTAVRRIDLLQ